MALFGIRFDFRNPAFAGVSMTDRYQAALEMTSWADGLGFVFAGLSEHHGSEDGYLPAALPMAAAMAARTSNIRIAINALVAPFYDPIRLAEDVAVVDRISGGRLDITLTNGYVRSEFETFGVPMSERAKRTTEAVETLRTAWKGEPFEFRGRTARVTPTPHQDGGPKISMGGSTEAAARRAGRIGDGFIPSFPELWDHYRDEAVKVGKPDPGPYLGGDTSVTHVAADPDQAWEQLSPYFLHEVNAYGAWAAEDDTNVSYVSVNDTDALRETGQYRVVSPDDLVTELQEKGPFAFLLLHPMVGGIPPEAAWESLRLLEHEVMPRLTS
jgi:alkanesulfonate monooxygenase SsuD/methylene tetrahydromethanopterin reductase-like flavin-dependent oxidoreductase (luciferase family)